MIYSGFIGPSYISESSIADGEELVNWYVEQLESPNAPTHSALYPTPGVTALSTLGVGVPGRGHYFDAGSGREFAVIGTDFVEVGLGGGTTILGTVTLNSHPATISSNGPGGDQIFITSGDNGYILKLSTNAFSQVRTGATTQGDQLDGYFIALDAATGTMFISNLLDGTTWDPTQFVQRSSQADPWVSVKVSPANRYIYLWGTKTAEVWYDAGTFPFPFALHPSGPIPYGIAAPFSAAVCEGTVAWLGATVSGEGAVYSASGLTASDISTFPFRYELAQYPLLSDAVGDSYNELGHLFYLLTFPTAEHTWAYDFNTPAPSWHKRGTWIAEDNEFTFWRPMYHAYAFNQHRMLDLSEGTIYQMASSIGTDVDDRVIRRVRRAPGLQFELQRVFWDAFELDLEVGLATITQDGVPGSVDWTDITNVTISGLDVSKTGGSNGVWDAGCVSSQELNTSGSVQLLASTQGIGLHSSIFGLGPLAGVAPFPDIPYVTYGILQNTVGTLQIVESNVTKVSGITFATSDILEVRVTGTTVAYYKNGSLLYTSLTAFVGPLAAVVLIQNKPDSVSSVTLSGNWDGMIVAEERAPQVMLRMSNDGGKTWGNEMWRSAGKIGEYKTRVRWNRCGQSRRRVFEISVTDSIPWRILNAYLTPRQPPNRISQIQGAQWG